MSYLKDISDKTQKKLDSQIDEFNKLRDRILILAGFALGLLTAVFTFWDNLMSPYNHFVTGAVVISFLSIAVLVYASYSNLLFRGITTNGIKDIVEYGDETGEEFYLSEIAYNLDAFDDNKELLKNLQKKLNWCLTAQAGIVLIIGFAIFLNSI